MFLCGVSLSAFGWFVYPAPEVHQGTSISPGEFVPSVFLVAGRGFIVPDDLNSPELGPFFRREATTLDPTTIPEDILTHRPSDWDRRHRYLYYAAAAIWWVFGISWSAMKLLPILLYGSMWPLLFRIFRLAGGRKISAVFTTLLMLTPGMIDLHWTVRDFSKGPFFLGVILIIGLILQRPMRARRLLTLALLAGVIAGIGTGFRRDLVMAILPALVAIVVMPRLLTTRPILIRAAAVALLLGAFLVAGAPIHLEYRGLGDPHDAIMGFSRPVDGGLGVTQADYQHLALQSDYQIHATMVSAVRRADGEIIARQLTLDEINAEGMTLVRWLVLTYPADVLTRTLASARWALSGGLPVAPGTAWLVSLLGIVLPALALFVVSSANARRGIALFLVCAPLFGYIALQFGTRHGFHLTFAPLWCMALMHTQWKLYQRYRACKLRHPDWDTPPPAFLRREGQLRGALVLVLAAVVLMLPLGAARVVQSHQVSTLIQEYLDAERMEILTIPRPVGDDWTLFAVDPNAPEPEVPYNTVNWPFREAYLVAKFAPGAHDIEGVMKYETDDDPLDLSFPFWIPASPENDEPFYYFFPTFENWHIDSGAWNRLSGVAVPNESADLFLGLYRLQQPEAFPFWSVYRIQGYGESFQYARRLMLIRSEPSNRIAPSITIPTWLQSIERSLGLHHGADDESTLLRLRSAIEADPLDASLWVRMGAIFERQGEFVEARDAYLKAIELLPRHIAGYRHLAAVLPQLATPNEALAIWRALADRYPKSVHANLYLGRALLAANERAGAREAAERAIAVAPWHPDGHELLARSQAASSPQ
mgnify:CR=1 FL=1